MNIFLVIKNIEYYNLLNFYVFLFIYLFFIYFRDIWG